MIMFYCSLLCLMCLRTTRTGARNVDSNDSETRYNNSFSDLLKINKNLPITLDTCSARIYDGIEVSDPKRVPYQVAIRKMEYDGMYWSLHCGGCLVTLTHVLTAAHCLVDKNIPKENVRVVAGTVKGEGIKYAMKTEDWRTIMQFYTHSKYSRGNISYDICIAKLNEPFEEKETIRPIRLHTPDMSDSILQPGTKCLLSGYGTLGESRTDPMAPQEAILRRACLPVLSHRDCSWYYQSEYLTETTFCAGSRGRGSCKGDSGSPLVCKGVLAGIVTSGLDCGSSPGLYARIISYTTSAEEGQDPFEMLLIDGAARIRSCIIMVVSLMSVLLVAR